LGRKGGGKGKKKGGRGIEVVATPRTARPTDFRPSGADPPARQALPAAKVPVARNAPFPRSVFAQPTDFALAPLPAGPHGSGRRRSPVGNAGVRNRLKAARGPRLTSWARSRALPGYPRHLPPHQPTPPSPPPPPNPPNSHHQRIASCHPRTPASPQHLGPGTGYGQTHSRRSAPRRGQGPSDQPAVGATPQPIARPAWGRKERRRKSEGLGLGKAQPGV